MKKMLLILNPCAGKVKLKNTLYSIVETFCKNEYTVTTQITLYSGHATELAESAAQNGYDLLVCCGGDGTLNEVISGIARSKNKIPLGYIPAGSTNDFAASMNLPIKEKTAAEIIVKGKPVKIDIGRFNQNNYFSYVASFGMLTSVSYETPQNIKNILGRQAYIFAGIKDIADIKKYHVIAKTDKAVYDGDYIFGAVCNSFSIGGIVKLSDHVVNMSDGMFEVLLVKYPNNLADFNEILLSTITSNYSSRMFDFFKTKEIDIKVENAPFWSLDGEKCEAKDGANIKILPSYIEIIK